MGWAGVGWGVDSSREVLGDEEVVVRRRRGGGMSRRCGEEGVEFRGDPSDRHAPRRLSCLPCCFFPEAGYSFVYAQKLSANK